MRLVKYLFYTAVLVCVYFASGLVTDNSIESFFIKSSDDAKTYEKFVGQFGTDEAIVIGICANLQDELAVRNLKNLSADLEKLPNATQVLSPLDFIANGVNLGEAMTSAKASRFISEDGGALLMMVFFDEGVKNSRREIFNKIKSIKEKWSDKFSCFHYAGHTIINAALDASGEEVTQKFFPILLLFTILLLWLVYRNVILVVAPLIITAAAEALTLGVVAMAKAPFGLVLTLIPVMIFIFTVASTIHISVHFLTLLDEQSEQGVNDIIRKTYDEKMGAIFYSLLTTAIGFFSLALSHVEPIHNLGLFTGIGCVMILISVWIMLPSFLKRVSRGSIRTPTLIIRWKGKLLEKIVTMAIRFRFAVIFLSFAIGASSIMALKTLPVNTNALEYFPEASSIRQDVGWMEKNLTGMSQVNLLIDQKVAPDKKKIFIDALNGSRGIVSIITKKSLEGFDNPKMVAGSRERIILQCVTGRKKSLDLILNEIGRAKKLAGIDEVTVTGLYPLLIKSQEEMIRTLIESLMVAVALIGVVFLFIARSIPLALAAAIPNLTTVFSVFLYMRFLSIPLDLTTVTVAAVALGIAVDDTVHLVMSYRGYITTQKNYMLAIQKSISTVGTALIMTSVILGLGFLTFSISSFLPIAEFGILMCAAIFTALVLDLVATPALLYVTTNISPSRDLSP